MISTRGRYAIRILLDLAEHRNGAYIPMKEVAARQDISLKYIEKMMPALKSAGLIDSAHGIGGGYRLTRDPDQYTLWEILSGDVLAGRRAGVCARRIVPDAAGVAGLLRRHPEIFFIDHTGGSDAAAAVRLCNLNHKIPYALARTGFFHALLPKLRCSATG